MIFGTSLCPNQTTRTETFERQADNAIFRYEDLGGQGSTALTVKVYHKDKQDTAWTAAATFSSTSKEVEGLMEQITIEFKLDSETIESTPDTPTNKRVRVLPVQWYNDPLYVAP